jgi:succinate dehydrogenase / fumarate reductase flavoprotein subunit
VNTTMQYEVYTHDVIVIGAGGAGLRAAIEVSAQGLSVGLVTKSLLGKAHTVMAEGGMAAALANVDEQDGWKTHFMDTMRGGKFLNNWRMAQIHAQEAPERVYELEKWGAVFDRAADGRLNQRAFGGHSYRRLAHVGDRTGLELIRTLQDKGVHSGIDIYMECTLTHLLKTGSAPTDPVAGAVGYWRQTGKPVLFRAKAIILATGGIGKAFAVTSNSWEYTADGQMMAMKAGAELMDMEFIQFHPTGMVWPPGVKGLLVTEAVRGEGGLLTNAKGERFMANVDPKRMELSTRDIVAKAIYKEVKEGRGSPHGGVFLDISHKNADYIKRKLPSMYHQFKELADVDITKEPMEVGPTTHYTMGGVKVDAESQQTTVPGLFAAGEVAAGLHGANRLGGNSLSDLIVFGRRAGIGACEYIRQHMPALPGFEQRQLEEALEAQDAPLTRTAGESPYAIHKELQQMMQLKCGIVREEGPLLEALEILEQMKHRIKQVRVAGGRGYNPGWNLALDLENMIAISEVVARCALQRKESRGGHTRLDCQDWVDPTTKKPFNTEWWYKNSITTLRDGGIHVYTQDLNRMPSDLRAFFETDELPYA